MNEGDRYMKAVARVNKSLILIIINFILTLIPTLIANEDCNGNGVIDSIDINNGDELDCDLNGVPDSCQLSGITEASLKTINLFGNQEKIVASDINDDGYTDLVSSTGILYQLPQGQNQFFPRQACWTI